MSTAIARASYNPDGREVVIQYHNGGIYAFQGVVRATWRSYRRAESKGKFVHEVFRKQHKFIKVH